MNEETVREKGKTVRGGCMAGKYHQKVGFKGKVLWSPGESFISYFGARVKCEVHHKYHARPGNMPGKEGIRRKAG